MKTMFNTQQIIIIKKNHLVCFHEKNTKKKFVLLSFNTKATQCVHCKQVSGTPKLLHPYFHQLILCYCVIGLH